MTTIETTFRASIKKYPLEEGTYSLVGNSLIEVEYSVHSNEDETPSHSGLKHFLYGEKSLLHDIISDMKVGESSRFEASFEEAMNLFDVALSKNASWTLKIVREIVLTDEPLVLELAKNMKLEGNSFFKDKKLEKSCQYYHLCLGILYSCPVDSKSLIELKIQTHMNAAVCESSLGNYNNAIYHCKHILESEHKTEEFEAKAHYRMGYVYEMINNLDLSLYHFSKSAKIKPDKTTYSAYERVSKAKEKMK